VNINRIEGKRKNYIKLKDKHTISEKEKVNLPEDTVLISGNLPQEIAGPVESHKTSPSSSSVFQGNVSHKEVPLKITLDIDGKSLDDTIMGTVTDSDVTLKMKHSNDIHGNMPYVATLIKSEEFWVDAGDTWQNYTLNSIISGGRKEVDLMNQRDCDIAIPGNHFYDDAGKKGGDMLVERSDFPYICSNIKGMAPYVIGEVEGIKIAFIGVRTTRKRFSMVDPSLVEDLHITDPVRELKKAVEEVRAKGATNIIVLSHLGLEPNEAHSQIISDKNIAKEVPGIDLIIGGHTHIPTHEEVVVNGTRIVHAGIDSHADVKTDPLYLGELSLKFDRQTGRLTGIDHKLIPVDRKNPLDKDVEKIQNHYLEEEKKTLEKKLGKSLGKFIHEVKTPSDSTLGNLITDAMRKATGADIALLDSNFFAERSKAGPPRVLPEGEITMKDLTETSLWIGSSLDLRVETWDVSGKTIKEALEQGVDYLLGAKEAEGLFQVSGLTMAYNPEKPEGERVGEVIVGDKPLDPDKNYKLTTTYYTGNWEPVFVPRDEKKVKDGPKLRHIVADYIKEKEVITPLQDGRIKVSSR